MGKRYSGDQEARDHTHTDKQHVNLEIRNRNTASELSVMDCLSAFTSFTVAKPSTYAPAMVGTFCPHEGFLTHQWNNTGNQQITDKTYD